MASPTTPAPTTMVSTSAAIVDPPMPEGALLIARFSGAIQPIGDRRKPDLQ